MKSRKGSFQKLVLSGVCFLCVSLLTMFKTVYESLRIIKRNAIRDFNEGLCCLDAQRLAFN